MSEPSGRDKVEHNLIGVGIGLVIYVLSGATDGGAFLGIALGLGYIIYNKSFF